MKLSHRLETVASFVTRGSIVADIGTDHGYIPIYLVEQNIAPRAIAVDVRTGPLERAKKHIQGHKLTEQITTRISDGLETLHPGEADCVIIAGMGGELVIHILNEGAHMWSSVKEWILSPQSELEKVRRYLEEQGFLITKETMMEEDGKYYTVMRVVRGTMKYEAARYYRYGRLLIQEKNPVLKEFLIKEKQQLEQILTTVAAKNTDMSRSRCLQVRKELMWIWEAQDEMQRTD